MNQVRVMGIVNVTPDSFSDGGKFYRPEEAVKRARNLIADGADIIDLGGESTRPGATPITWEEEWSRIEPVLSQLISNRNPSACAQLADSGSNRNPSALARDPAPVLSVDTYHLDTAERAIAMGAGMINCVKAELVPAMLQLAERHPSVELVIPCRLNSIRPFDYPDYPIVSSRVYLDPMIGFDTTREEDVGLLRSIPELARHGRVLVGASRKRIVKKLVGEKTPGKDVAGNLAIAAWAAMNGASAVRVHDVKETVQALRVLEALA